MFNQELLKVVEHISREKNIDKQMVFEDLEMAMLSAARKAYGAAEDVTVRIDRTTGEISATHDSEPISMRELGRIAAQTAKQVMIQKFREAERDSLFEEFSERVGQIITGTVARYEGGALVLHLGRTEGFLPRSEQIPGETHHPGERVRGMILDVREQPHEVRIVLTRTHPDYIRRLFDLEVPEVGERIIEIKALAREAGYRTKVAVSSIDSKVDAVGACVGVRGSRIRNIVDELNGEKIDIVRWNESSQVLIANALKPAEVQETALCFELGRASVVVAEDQLSLAIGKRGQNVRLGARLTGWDIDIVTPANYDKGIDQMSQALREIEGIDDILVEKLLAMGIIRLADLEEVGAEPLVTELELDEKLVATLLETAKEAAERFKVEEQAAKELAAAEEAKKAEEAAQASDGEETPDGEQPVDGEPAGEAAESEGEDGTDLAGDLDSAGEVQADKTDGDAPESVEAQGADSTADTPEASPIVEAESDDGAVAERTE
ncbi:MAG: transcription termination factor NusA [Planctomycetes bacterium]|nr:transcription termination factor NusA [Planctomycetota bacterium]